MLLTHLRLLKKMKKLSKKVWNKSAGLAISCYGVASLRGCSNWMFRAYDLDEKKNLLNNI